MKLDITKKEFDKFLEEGKLLIIDFHAEWCSPCKSLSPTIEELSDEYEDRVIIRKINVDEENEVSNQFGIRSIPTILFFKDGEIVERKVGNISKSELEDSIDIHI